MFTEFLEKEQWQLLMPGVHTCIFDSIPEGSQIPTQLKPGHVEVVFCTEGSMNLKRHDYTEVKLSSREILLLSNGGNLCQVLITLPVKGICISVNTAEAGESFLTLCHALGDIPFSMRSVGEIMQTNGGFKVLPVTPWSRSAFYTLKAIPHSSWGHYCVLKTFELLYLMCTQDSGMDAQSENADSGSYLTGIAENMRAYMEEHLDEKLTILDLSRRFHLSRTACKSCFRSCYGQPIHSWILDRRMEQATDLLEHTNMPVLQIAQSVGYSGVSQFNAAFKQRYGKTPREYRKMSVSGIS